MKKLRKLKKKLEKQSPKLKSLNKNNLSKKLPKKEIN